MAKLTTAILITAILIASPALSGDGGRGNGGAGKAGAGQSASTASGLPGKPGLGPRKGPRGKLGKAPTGITWGGIGSFGRTPVAPKCPCKPL